MLANESDQLPRVRCPQLSRDGADTRKDGGPTAGCMMCDLPSSRQFDRVLQVSKSTDTVIGDEDELGIGHREETIVLHPAQLKRQPVTSRPQGAK